ncbi:molybdopterin converting factor subunit 1 [Halobacillus litoralis]|uniref:Molybdopterin synthase sulfur carrier subunit n=1 Tax=Halobacillus litoralis TaxID=45668 RepID=A0A845DNC3_9BACI|nr:MULTISPECIES: molybdopterin converting factor subunit 1 [Halobacillus]MYL18439.1 molybdopterin converting factor subunit 1 [Halobacillus litoralis]MYL30554.1 molybdopterin converting factor subunit 1 [Halobacillus halophilus]MYL38570.1 molybdopterin converting factor subunit 1 [Halobacillus litoralis]
MNQLLFFAGLKEAAGTEKVDMDLAGLTVEEVKKKVGDVYPKVQIQTSMIAVNEEFALRDHKIEEGDTIAFLPPVSGG